MLKELYIENLAVIEQMCLLFSEGFTVFTGETGAGKSILIDAINLILGQRANKEIVRTGAQKAVVTAVISNVPEEAERKLAEYGYESEQGELLVSREIHADGKGSARLMGRPVTVSILRELGAMLINIHGQHDNQVLLNSENHLDILDLYAGTGELFTRYQEEYKKYTSLKNEWRKVSMDEAEKARRLDLLRYQIAEISAISPKEGEEEALEEKLQMIRHSAKIVEQLSGAYNLLFGSDEESGACDLLRQSADSLEEAGEYHRAVEEIAEQLRNVQYEAEDAAEKVSRFLERFEFDPNELDGLEQRLDELRQLKRKYGTTIGEVLEFYKKAETELSQIELSEERRQELTGELEIQKKRVMTEGNALSKARHEAARQFVERISEQLVFLDMPNVSMKVQIEKAKYGARGCDAVEFLFSTNRGEELRPLGKIASGGELSRIMLAIKSVLAQKDSIDTLIFDEIDTGVSGKSSQKIGLKLREAAQHRQVLCVTHSAQVAALAQNHFLIRKETEGERTFTRVSALSEQERIEEIARIIGTDQISELTLQNAKEMVERGKNPVFS
ncbi:DNA repair protein RecN [Massiliimalia timonensis]|uniref:DNA repair protein RecN n=1 Tax=Massiliimalia timonensis TaxID=1987501 RepID=UPI00189F5BDD|nr:DNA repair protein RecN [Massiliimalia timonensis]